MVNAPSARCRIMHHVTIRPSGNEKNLLTHTVKELRTKDGHTNQSWTSVLHSKPTRPSRTRQMSSLTVSSHSAKSAVMTKRTRDTSVSKISAATHGHRRPFTSNLPRAHGTRPSCPKHHVPDSRQSLPDSRQPKRHPLTLEQG